MKNVNVTHIAGNVILGSGKLGDPWRGSGTPAPIKSAKEQFKETSKLGGFEAAQAKYLK